MKGYDSMIYADNAATTRLSPVALEAMIPYLTKQYGNPSSLYAFGQVARQGVEQSRKTVARLLNAAPEEVYFTSGGTEADNWAIRGMTAHLLSKGKTHIVASAFEHHAVLHTLQAMERMGFSVTLLPVYENGIVRAKDLAAAITENTGLVTVMLANNEIGTIQPIAELAAICRARGIYLHTDAVQAVGHIPVDFAALGVDMLSLSGHKFHGPKGVGALLVNKALHRRLLLPYFDGGAQERGRRAGTENVAGIVGMVAALEEAVAHFDVSVPMITRLRDNLIAQLLEIPSSRLNGDAALRLPGNINISFIGIEGESLLLMLDMKGICASSGSACTSGSLDPSHVLLAIGLIHEIAHGSLRLSLSEENTVQEMNAIAVAVAQVVARLREMSPIWHE